MLQTFDPRNKDIKIWVGDRLYPRQQAKVSVFDSVVQGGDAVWEGLRLYKQGVLCLHEHLTRLEESAHALSFVDVPSREHIISAIKQTVAENNMAEGVHMRLTLTRGEKITSGMDPRLNQMGSTLIIVPEYKPPVYDNNHGISVITSSQRRNNPQFLDSKIHHNNLLNNILAKIEANVAGADAALMLDKDGFAAELNGTNIFMIKNSTIYTPFPHACLPGITRNHILHLCNEHSISIQEKNISLVELYNADMVFCSGTMGELTPIHTIDGRTIKNESALWNKVLDAYITSIPAHCTAI